MGKLIDLSKFRAATLGKTRTFKSETVNVDGTDFEVRQTTVAHRGAIQNKAMNFRGPDGKTLDAPEFDTLKFQIYSVIYMTYAPGTDQRIFSVEDYDLLSEQPAGGWFSALSESASNMAIPDEDKVKKPLEKTAKKG
jgi:hypothetical protein